MSPILGHLRCRAPRLRVLQTVMRCCTPLHLGALTRRPLSVCPPAIVLTAVACTCRVQVSHWDPRKALNFVPPASLHDECSTGVTRFGLYPLWIARKTMRLKICQLRCRHPIVLASLRRLSYAACQVQTVPAPTVHPRPTAAGARGAMQSAQPTWVATQRWECWGWPCHWRCC